MARDSDLGKYGIVAGWLALAVAVTAAYWPGLNGPFVLDDLGSVAALGERGGVVDWETFKAFVFGGTSGPTGRPIALLSFLVDAQDWPADSGPFKRTNLIIHCLCALALGALIHQVLRLLNVAQSDRRAVVFAACGFWLLHPFLVSTTLYVVQRMAQLSTLFVLIGLALYLRGRVQVRANPRKAYLLMTGALGVFGLLAVLSKENGILLPTLALVVELTVVASRQEAVGRLNRFWMFGILIVPTMIVFLYLGERVFRDNFLNIVPPRDFSIYERLLTQPRVLVDYLQHWFIPKLYTTGVFQDHFLKSTGLLTPISTALSALLHLVVIVLAVLKRRQWPLFALAALFFYAGHLLESTVINLELYFEHRSYLAAALLFLPLLVALKNKTRIAGFLAISIGVMCLFGGFTRYSSSVWSSLPSMIEASALRAPTSARAQVQYSVLLFNADRYDDSLRVLEDAIKNQPEFSPFLSVNRLYVLCNMNRISGEEFDAAAAEIWRRPYDARLTRAYIALVDDVVADKCPEIDARRLRQLFTGMLNLPFNANSKSLGYSHIKYFVGLSHAFLGQREESVAAFEDSLTSRPGASHAMMMAAVLATNSFNQDALRFSDIALAEVSTSSRSSIRAASVSESDIRIFQNTVRADIKALQDADTSHEIHVPGPRDREDQNH